MKTMKYQLKNGMKTLLHPSHKSPVISVQVWVRTGSADERKKEEGISHFIEHLVFKGTDKFKTGEIAQIVEGSGGELNAYTSFDQTVFHITISKNFVETALEALSQMMGHAHFDPVEVDNEREVVIEEIKRGMDNPGRKASQLFFSTMFKKHPYGVPVIGFAENVSSWSTQKIKNYFQQRYSPQNYFLVVTGDFQTPEMKSLIQKHFGPVPSFKPRKIVRAKEPVWKGLRTAVEKSVFKESYTYIGFPIPPVTHADVPALDVLSMILGQGDSSRLVKKLRLDKPIVNSVGASTWTPVNEGAFIVSLTAEKANLPKALHGALEEVFKLTEDFVTKEELEKAVINLSSDQVYSLETVDGISRRLGSFEFYMKDPEYYQKYLKHVHALTPEKIYKVAKKYLTPEKMIMTCLSDQEVSESKAMIETAQKDFKALFHKKPFVLKAKPSQKASLSKTEKVVLKNGTTLFFNSQQETPTISARVAFLGGSRAQPAGKEGMVELMSRVWASSTLNRTEEDIHKIIDQSAAGLGAFGGRNSFGLNLDCLSPMFPQMIELMTELIVSPGFQEMHIEREKQILQHQIQSKYDHPSTVTVRNYMSTLFQGHPYAQDPMGTKLSVESITREEIVNYYENLVAGSNLTCCVVGDVDKKDIVRRFEALDALLPAGAKYEKSFPLTQLSENKFIYTHMMKEQSHIILGYHGLCVDSPQRHIFTVLESVLSGMGGRLFNELREKNSLAYTVAPQKLSGIDAGSFGAYIGCSPDKSEKAVHMMLQEFAKLMNEKVPKEELERCQRYLIGSHAIDLQRKSSLASGILFDEIYGIDSSEMLRIAEIYRSVTSDQIQDLAQTIFSQNYVCSVVGQSDIENKAI